MATKKVLKPKLNTIIKMSKVLNTSTDYLLDLTDNPVSNNFVLNEKELGIINNYRTLSNEEKMQVETYIQAIIDINNLK